MTTPDTQAVTAAPTPVVACPSHAGHAPSVEVQCGRAIPAFDTTARVEAILAALAGRPEITLTAPGSYGLEPIRRVHGFGLIEFLRTAWASAEPPGDGIDLIFADTFLHDRLRQGMGPLTHAGGGALGRYCFDTITGVGPSTWTAAAASADTALTAAELARRGAPLAVGLCRPPGHHVGPDLFGGGCYLNNAGIAAQSLRDGGVSRVAVLDLDFHHGNGTQALFYDRADVLYASLHGDPARHYPYFTGWPDETGAGEGSGYTVNLPLPPRVGVDDYLDLLETATDRVLDGGFEAVVVSLGFDTYDGDVSGDAALTTADYRRIGRHVAGLGLPTVALLEGGYSVTALGDNLWSWIKGFRAEQGERP
ncbi:histone deacetylase family protein [Planotetraspora sp. GP83]|uniref:histone deacetylase family protein n=1 Tax=Planotetraspora sp. GP83 TaxID=3156264 RepID=UPI0035177D99